MDDVEALDEFAHQMFRQYSRMEHALKAAGHLERQTGDAKASWVSFGAEIDVSFRDLVSTDSELRDAVTYLQQHPPKKQVVSNGTLGWSDAPPTAPTETGVLLLYVGRVRNNLFHGGKFNGRWIDPGRSRELLPRCLIVLDRALHLSGPVKAAFEH